MSTTPPLNIVGIIQARMSSKRLPGKVMQDICGKPMLERVIERVRMARSLTQVIVATTTDPGDDPLEQRCRQIGIPCFRGSLHDVLDRFYRAAQTFRADVIVRFTADCPLLDPGLIDHTVQAFLESGADFAANRLPPPFRRTYPIGLDTEVCSFAALERAWREAEQTYEREHVMPYLYDAEGRFKVLRVEYERDLSHYRWTVDTAEDLEVVRRIYQHFGENPQFTWLDVLAFCESQPDLTAMNAQVKHKTFMDYDERQKTR